MDEARNQLTIAEENDSKDISSNLEHMMSLQKREITKKYKKEIRKLRLQIVRSRKNYMNSIRSLHASSDRKTYSDSSSTNPEPKIQDLENKIDSSVMKTRSKDTQEANTSVYSKSIYLSEKAVKILEASLETLEIKSNYITPYSRCLVLDAESLLVTGGVFDQIRDSSSSVIINTRTKTITPTKPLILGRSFHAMTWINNKPAVIGGYCQTSLSSVEIFEDNAWKSISYLNQPRQEHTACCNSEGSYVLLGKTLVGSSCVPANSVEKYCNGRWDKLSIQFPFDVSEFCEEPGSLSSSKDELIILGGWDQYVEVFKLGLSTGQLNLVSRTLKASKFPWNCWVQKEDRVVGFDDEGEVISFKTL